MLVPHNKTGAKSLRASLSESPSLFAMICVSLVIMKRKMPFVVPIVETAATIASEGDNANIFARVG